MPLTTIYDGGSRIIGDATALEESLHPAVMAYVNVMRQASGGNYSMTANEIDAVNNMVKAMVANGIWSKMKAVYPVIGGTAAAHKYNLVDSRDLDAAFRLVFNGGVTHNINGATFNGTNGYADTYLSPSGALTANSNHLSLYSRTSAQRVSGANDMGMGDNIAGNNSIVICIRRPGDVCYYLNNAILISTSNTNGQGLYIGTTRANNDRKYFKNNTSLGTNTTLYNQVLSNFNFFIGAYNAGGVASTYADFQTAFATIGDGLNDTEATNFYNLIQNFNTTLSRQV